MNTKTLLTVLGVVLLLAGALLACFTPGGFLNKESARIDTPLGSISVEERGTDLSRPGPMVGLICAGLGVVALIVGSAKKGC